MKVATVVMTAVLALAAQPGHAQAPDTTPTVDLPLEGAGQDLHVVFVAQPSADQMSEEYPDLAQALNWGGIVRLSCSDTPAGTLDHCTAERETPPGIGFGQAAIRISRYFKVRPRSVDGRPVGGDTVGFSIHFTMPPTDAEPIPQGPAPSPRALELARQLAAFTSEPVSEHNRAEMAVNRMQGTVSVDWSSPAARAVLDAYREAARADSPLVQDAIARAYASVLSEAELTDIVAFMGTPSGHAWLAAQNKLVGAEDSFAAAADQAISDDARKRYCAKAGC